MRFILLLLIIASQAHAQQNLTDSANVEGLLLRSRVLVNKPGEDPADLKNAANLAFMALKIGLQSKLVNGQARSYVLLAQIAREQGKNEDAKIYIDKAATYLSVIKPWPAAAAVYFELSTQLGLTKGPVLQQKIKYYEQYLDILKFNEKDTIKIADATKYYADILNIAFFHSRAMYYIKQALELYNSQHYKQLQDVYDLMGDINYRLGNTQEAIRNGLLAEKTAEEFHDSSATACTIYNRIAFYYSTIGKLDKNVYYLEKAYAIALKQPDLETRLFIAVNLGSAYNDAKQYDKAMKVVKSAIADCPPEMIRLSNLLQIHLCKIYSYNNDFQHALEVFNRIKPVLKDKNVSPITRANLATAAIHMYFGMKAYKQTRYYIEQLESLKTEGDFMFIKSKAERHFFQLDSAQGNFESAIRHYQVYKLYADSMALIKYNRQLSQIQVEYETEKKDHDLKIQEEHISLLTDENNQQKDQIHSDTIKRNFTYAIALLLLLLLSIAYWAYRTKRKSNVQLQAQQFEINQQNAILKQLLEEREWLLREVHHRVKNNLQIVISLLNSQARHLNSESAKQALRESKNRMQAISIIHQKLYRSDSFSSVNMDFYVRELLDFLQDSFSIHDVVSIDTNCTDIDVSQAVPIGLIINEAVTNAIKYAVPHTADPLITINMHCKEEDVFLRITDNGPGMPPDYNKDSFGISLIMGLVRQLRGKATFTNEGGTHIHITFKRTKVLA